MIEKFAVLAQKLTQRPRISRTFLLGIDGLGGSGKTRFADLLTETLAGLDQAVQVVRMDDFYFPSAERSIRSKKLLGRDFDWERLVRQVLLPLAQGRDTKYQRYDWALDCLADYHVVPAEGFVLVEGVYALRQETWPFYDFGIWIDCAREIRLERGLARDGQDYRDIWEKDWMQKEDNYVATQAPQDRAHIIVDTSATEHDPQKEFVVRCDRT